MRVPGEATRAKMIATEHVIDHIWLFSAEVHNTPLQGSDTPIGGCSGYF